MTSILFEPTVSDARPMFNRGDIDGHWLAHTRRMLIEMAAFDIEEEVDADAMAETDAYGYPLPCHATHGALALAPDTQKFGLAGAGEPARQALAGRRSRSAEQMLRSVFVSHA
ncbi:MAG: hypothetical protein AAFR79_07590 [Pseudomonadota bacterium]